LALVTVALESPKPMPGTREVPEQSLRTLLLRFRKIRPFRPCSFRKRNEQRYRKR
jgi:hypothetical protein